MKHANAHRLVTAEHPPEERVRGSRTTILAGRAKVNIVRPVTGACSGCSWTKRADTRRIVENAFYREHLYPLSTKIGRTA